MFAAPLSGLPPYGPPALSFPRPDRFSEGFVVEFMTSDGDVWVGNFAKFDDGGLTAVYADLGHRAILVVAGGAGYLIDVEERRLAREIGFDLQHIWFDAAIGGMVVSNGLWFEAFDTNQVLWRSRRFSWDGIRNVRREGLTVAGEAFNPIGDQWLPFRLDVSTGDVLGGSYSGPEK